MTAHKQAAGGGVPQAALDKSRNHYSTDAETQRQRLLTRLRAAPLTTTQARTELDIMHPAARVQELRERGYKIVTHWQKVDTGKAKHRTACYVLLGGGSDAIIR